MGGEGVGRSEVALVLEEFSRTSLERRARDLGISISTLVRQAALYYLAVRGSERMAIRMPRFARESEPTDEALKVTLELDEADWSALEVEAVHQRVPIERLIAHAATLFLADVDSGRVAVRILEDEEDEPDLPA
jgi:hypothetical protein